MGLTFFNGVTPKVGVKGKSASIGEDVYTLEAQINTRRYLCTGELYTWTMNQQYESVASIAVRAAVKTNRDAGHEIPVLEATRLNLASSLGGLESTGSQTHDDPSFNLFNATSFETLTSANDPFSFMSPSRERSLKHDSGQDFGLPELKHDLDDSDYSLGGDISPIQLNRGSCQDNNEHRTTGRQWATGFNSPDLASGLVSNPFYVLRSARDAFKNCCYLLNAPREDELEVCPVNISGHGHVRQYQSSTAPSSSDLKLASRRVETAVIAFGGTITAAPRVDHRLSIFRMKTSSRRFAYERQMHKRYHVSGSVISWDMEEDPPIFVENETNEGPPPLRADGVELPAKALRRSSATIEEPTSSSESSPTSEFHNEFPKLKYRCKLCGQPKQSHNCPYRQCMHRSIGVMVYPAVNAYTAAEPGQITAPLTKMNNFVSYESDHGSLRLDHLSQSGQLTHSTQEAPVHAPQLLPVQVSPESRVSTTSFFNSPQSSLSNQSEETMLGVDAAQGRVGVKRSYSGTELPRGSAAPTLPTVFVNSVTLRPEHYRTVGQLDGDEKLLFHYPAIPLTFAERKRLVDTLFHMSSEIPQFAADVATLLHVARENNEWDLAVAELLTQVVVAMYCSEGDHALEGLREYLLGLGIAC
ncbi:hypothetical protein MPSEU_000614500 [Mayamaea pseudoterrestris]|nr:hypothetical protein MPSEU_000614500 [Mayamaea pseudoterrestris]